MSADTEAEILAQFLLARRIVTPEQLKDAFDAQTKIQEVAGFRLELEEILTRKGLLNPQQMAFVQASLGHGRSDLIPGYEVTAKLGQGGMGAVYKARQTAMDRVVAIKVLLPHFAREKNAVERFLREAKVLAKLSHPNVMRGIDAGYQKGIYYYVMEYFEGQTLESILKRRGRLAPVEALSIVKQVALALDHANGFGIVHRDIKPDNIMIDAGGHVKVTDLGLAKMLTGPSTATLTQEGFVMGTPAYMSPEQAKGHEDVDTRSDLYSLGLSYFEMLLGQRAHSGDSPVVIFQKKLKEDVPVERLRQVGVSDGVIAVVRKMTARDREERYQSAEELLQDLERVEHGATVAAPSAPASPTRRLARSGRMPRAAQSAPVSMGVVAGLAVAVVGVIVVVMMSSGRSYRPSPPPSRTPEPAPIVAAPPPPETPAKPAPAPSPGPQPPPPRIDSAGGDEAWKTALEYETSFRDSKPEEVLLNFIEVREKLLGTPKIVDCERKVEEWKRRMNDAVLAAQFQFKSELDSHVSAERFGAARGSVAAAGRRFASTRLSGLAGMDAYRNWPSVVRAEESKMEAALDRAASALRRSAETLAAEMRFADARSAWQRIKAFGIDALTREADQKISGLDQASAAKEEELRRLIELERPKVYAEWRRGVQLARERKYSEAGKPLRLVLPALRHPESMASAESLIEGLGLAGSVLEDARQNKPVEEEPTDKVLSYYKSARRSIRTEDQPLARVLFALLDGELAEAETELRSFERAGGKLRVEYEELLKELKNIEATRATRAKEAADKIKQAQRDHGTPARRDQALEAMRSILRDYADVLKRDQIATINRYLGQGPKTTKKEIVVHADEIGKPNGRWKHGEVDHATALKKVLTSDTGGRNYDRFERDNPSWFEFEVDVLADAEYTLWIHMSARTANTNSVFVQFEDAVGTEDRPYYPIESEWGIVLQYWRDGETQSFGWTNKDERNRDNPPATFRFRTAGKKRIRIYVREEGAMIDQFVLSSDRYKTDRPQEHRLERAR